MGLRPAALTNSRDVLAAMSPLCVRALTDQARRRKDLRDGMGNPPATMLDEPEEPEPALTTCQLRPASLINKRLA
jgi:hypothetical protein